MELVNQFFQEILATIAILTLIIIYLILKKPSLKTREIKDKEDEKKLVIESTLSKDEFDNEDAIFTKAIEEVAEVKEEKKTEPIVVKHTNRKKREVPVHDKIVKDNFEEFTGMRVLIAEDNLINQKVLTGLLSTSGIKITIANDGQEALDILKEDINFSLILMDAHMPIVDGFQATRFIRNNPDYDHIPIVALSGDTASDDIKNMLNVGMEGHLEKPLKMDALYDVFYMYTTGDEANQTFEKIAEPVEVSNEEFNIKKGLEICGGDKEFYLEILNEFIDKYADAPAIIKHFINTKDSKSADKMLLDISGVTANIGADKLYHITLELKKSIANPDDLEYVTALKSFKRSLENVNKLIEAYLTS